MSPRAVSPVLGVVLLVALTVVGAAAVGAAITLDPSDPPPTAAFDAEADATGEIRITHRGGDGIDPATLRVRVSVDGTPLAEQPPVPFFSAVGFESGPTGAFNSATAGEWTAGEAASFRVADTNAPALRPGATVEIRLYAEGSVLATLETTVAVQSASIASVSSAAAPEPSSSSGT